MDRPLDSTVRRRRLARRVALAAVALAVPAVGLRWGTAALRPAVARAAIRTAVVDVGPVEAVIAASGTVLPEVEQVVSMPVEARVLRILKRPGDAVARGEAILDLDLSAAALEQERLDQQLALRANQQARTRLDLAARITDLESQREIKRLQLAALEAAVARDRQLQERGLMAREALAQAELAAAQAAAELRKLAAEERHARESTRTALDGLGLEMATLRRERAEARRQLERATTRADRPGVVTWTVAEEGAIVRKGEAIARIADLRSFRVEATLPDIHGQRVAAGLPAVVRVNDDAVRLQGTVTAVHPTVRDGLITFAVALAEKQSPVLRPNLRVDVLVIQSRKARVPRIARGPFAEAGGGLRDVFVVHPTGGSAQRRRVRLGLASADHFEVLDGLAPGDQVITSDPSDFLDFAEVQLR